MIVFLKLMKMCKRNFEKINIREEDIQSDVEMPITEGSIIKKPKYKIYKEGQKNILKFIILINLSILQQAKL